MPATAGRVRMPPNNRLPSNISLQTHSIWQNAIGYDPHKPLPKSSNSIPDNAENSYESYQALLELARITGPNGDEVRGGCTKCGQVGHLSYQCRNLLSVKGKEKDPGSIQADVATELDKLIKGKLGKAKGKDVVETDNEEEDEDSESSDSGYDSGIERLIAQRYGKKSVRKEKLKNKDSDVDGSDTDSGDRKKRGRSKKTISRKRKHDDSENDRKKRRKEKRRKRDEDGERRRRHRKSSK